MRTWHRLFSALSVSALVALGTGQAAGQPAKGHDVAAFAPCSDCHDTVAAHFPNNPHARLGDSKAVCESCHGDTAKHLANPDASTIAVPKGAAGAKICLGCHQKSPEFDRAGHGFHAAAAVNCTDCHSVHGSPATAPALLRTTPSTQLCESCHPAQKNLFAKPYAHHLARGGMECVSCHNPHGGRGEHNLKTTSAGELPCLSCHTEKQGPFVFSHVSGFEGNCLTCHEPHGSNNPKMLIRARVDQVCLECHTTLPAGTLGAQPPSFHDLRSARYQNCTVCHVAVHGSNSSPMLLK
ncbi:MAG: DmsE family decaheme c-type cytochrome [Thermoanaerobaculaceae bacterium]|nr:DmsE family decaheme c-type cytochrome [Thermoanaerobaculaceae bacterium]TAM56940.1 MAG: DmsE family decaheme c-type cytochrome [Acidobacteriota bacterium]